MTRVINWVEETRQALTRKQNHVNLTADDLLAWEALPHILNQITALRAEVEWMRAEILTLRVGEHRFRLVADKELERIAAGPPADNEATR